MFFFISEAFADNAAASQTSGFMSFLPMIAFIGILYFLLIRPQQKRQKQHQALLSAIKKGDKVITNSGLIATVSKVLNDQEVILEISDGVCCKFIKSAISGTMDKKESAEGKVANKSEKSPVSKKKD